jgi:hypothetical protein
MPEFPIPPEVVEAAAKAMLACEHEQDGLTVGVDIPTWEEWKADPRLTEEGRTMEECLAVAEAAIRGALDKLGLREEQETHRGMGLRPEKVPTGRVRLVGDWRPVDGEPNALSVEDFYERTSWALGTRVSDADNPSCRGQIVKRGGRQWVSRYKLPMVRWDGKINAEVVEWGRLVRAKAQEAVRVDSEPSEPAA